VAKSRWLRIQSVNRVLALTFTFENDHTKGSRTPVGPRIGEWRRDHSQFSCRTGSWFRRRRCSRHAGM